VKVVSGFLYNRERHLSAERQMLRLSSFVSLLKIQVPLTEQAETPSFLLF